MPSRRIDINVLQTDVVVIGAGPVGLFSVFECGMLGLRCHVVDALDSVGGQCTALYPEKPIYDIPAYPRISGADLILRLMEQAAPFDPQYRLGERVEGIERAGEGRWIVRTSTGAAIDCAAIIVAAGSGAFGPNRPPLDNLGAFEGKSVFYSVGRRESFRDTRVVIAGGGDSAVDWAISLAEIARSVTVVHRRNKFRAAPESERRLNELVDGGMVELAIPFQLQALEGRQGQLNAVTLAGLDGTPKTIEADALLCFFGLAMDLGPIGQWGLELDHKHIVVAPATCATNIPAVFAIGDIATYPGKQKLILTGFAEAAMAAHAIHPLARPGQALHFEYSTSKGVPA